MKHIILSGERGVGKSTLIQRLLQESGKPVCGFVTKKLPDGEDGLHPVYIHPAAQREADRQYTPQNCLGVCNRFIRNINIEVFDTVGVSLLQALPPNAIVVMDELGFMEAQASRFTARVLDVLDGDTPVIAAVKARTDIPFLHQVHSHSNACVYSITPQNRDALFATLLPIVKSW